MKRFLIQGSAFVLSTLMLVACGDKTEPPEQPAKPAKPLMDLCHRLPAADVQRVLETSALQAESYLTNNPHLYAGGCQYKAADGTVRAEFLAELDKDGSSFNFIPGRYQASRGFTPSSKVSGYDSIAYPDGRFVWTSNEDVMFQLSLFDADGKTKLLDASKAHALATAAMPTPNPDAVSEPTSESAPEHADQTAEPASH